MTLTSDIAAPPGRPLDPGNLLFLPDGRLGVLDYGCVQPVDRAARRDIRDLIVVALDGGDLSRPARRALGIVEADDVTEESIVAIVRLALAPILAPQPYRFTRGFAAEITRSVADAKMSLASRYMTRRGAFAIDREGVMFVARNLFGLAAIWSALEARGDFRALTRSLLAERPGPSDPLVTRWPRPGRHQG